MPASELPPFRHHYHATGKGRAEGASQPSYPHSRQHCCATGEGSRAEGASQQLPHSGIIAMLPAREESERVPASGFPPFRHHHCATGKGAEQRVPASRGLPPFRQGTHSQNQGLSCPHYQTWNCHPRSSFLWHPSCELAGSFG